jgi:hypothetical protein
MPSRPTATGTVLSGMARVLRRTLTHGLEWHEAVVGRAAGEETTWTRRMMPGWASDSTAPLH